MKMFCLSFLLYPLLSGIAVMSITVLECRQNFQHNLVTWKYDDENFCLLELEYLGLGFLFW